jgi:hypothetical protein
MKTQSIGEKNLNSQDRLEYFLNGITEYIEGKNLAPCEFKEEFQKADQISNERLKTLTRDELFDEAFLLYQYADHVGQERAHTENVIRWCNDTLQRVIAYGVQHGEWDKYEKHDTKVATILSNDAIASAVNNWKLTAEGRLEHLRNREYNIKRKAEILIEKGKRK